MTDSAHSSAGSVNPSEAWQQAVSYHNAGRLADAAALYELVLRQQPDSAEANHNYGILQYQLGFLDRAVTHLGRAVGASPATHACWLAYGEALLAAGRADVAERELNAARAAHGFDDQQFQELLARARQDDGSGGEDAFQAALDAAIDAYQAGDVQRAETQADEITRRWSDQAGGWAVLGVVRAARGHVRDAIAAYHEVLQREPDDPETLNNLGNALQELRRWDDAIAAYRRALAVQPESGLLYFNLGRALHGAQRLGDARAAYTEALRREPALARAHGNLGSALHELGLPERAETAYREALRHDPASQSAHAGLLEVLEKTNRTDELRETLEAARPVLGAHDPWVALADARLARREGRYADARDRLEAVHSDDERFRAARAFALAALHEQLGDPDAAISRAAEGNELASARYAAKGVSAQPFRDRIAACREAFTDDWVARWSPIPAPDDRPDPVFLVGFPRSGTTLLSTVLDAHPHISAADETQALNAAINALTADGRRYPDDLANMDTETAAYLREVYFTELEQYFARHGDDRQPGGRGIVVDKLPLNMVEAGLIQRIFPNAQIIFMLRHPYDCVISAFMNDFAPNGAMANFLTMRDAASFYDEVMDLWNRYRHVLTVKIHDVVYERLVTAYSAELERLLGALNLGWDDSLVSHAESGAVPQHVTTPSYHQVAQPLHTGARERWRLYRRHLTPVQHKLAPWAEAYGYATD